MKKILFAIFALTLIAACDKDENEPNEVNVEKTTISAKWTISNSSDYKSFEFNESGNYIVVKNITTRSINDPIVLFGTYEIIDGKKIVLSDFGTLIISVINENSISFSFQLTSNPDNDVIINASKQEEIESSTNTDLLCQTWMLVSFGEYEIQNFYVLFSKAGTYLINNEAEGEEIIKLGTWSWCNTDENKIAFTIENVLDCDGIEIVKDLQLTSNSFIGTDMENGEPMEMIMESASSTESVRLANQKTGTNILGIKK
jgi:hypothetical protein